MRSPTDVFTDGVTQVRSRTNFGRGSTFRGAVAVNLIAFPYSSMLFFSSKSFISGLGLNQENYPVIRPWCDLIIHT